MPTPKTLSLLCPPNLLYPDLEAIGSSMHRFIGKVWNGSQWEDTLEPVSKPYRAEYAASLLSGELLPGDSATEAWLKSQR